MDELKFKTGDYAKCMDVSDVMPYLYYGKTYAVISSGHIADIEVIEVQDEQGNRHFLKTNRFIKKYGPF